MAEQWETPKTWEYKEAPGSDALNEQLRDNMNYLKEALPAGVIIGWGKTTPPEQWLLCDGTAVSRTTYVDLFTVIGDSYGVGNGSTTFNLPDYRGKVMVGRNSSDGDFDTIGETGGAKTVSIQHTHSGPNHSHSTPNHSHTYSGTTSGDANFTKVDSTDIEYVSSPNHTHTYSGTTSSNNGGNTGSAGTGQTGGMSTATAPSIVQPFQVSNFIIKF